MDLFKIYSLIFLLIGILICSTFVGTTLKEGILFKDLSTIKTILNDTTDKNASYNISIIKKINISDTDFKTILEDDKLSDIEKVGRLKMLVMFLLTGTVKEGKLSDTIEQDITLKTVMKNEHIIL